MDSSSWIHGYAANINDSGGRGGISGFMCDYTASCIPAVFQCRKQEQQENELLVSSQIQQHLNQISMQLNIDDESAAAYSSQHGSSVVDDFDFLPNSRHATGGCSFPSSSSTSSSFRSAWQPCSPETSSTVAQFLATGLQFPEVSSLVPPGVVLPDVDQYAGNFQDTPVTIETSAFRRYERHLAPQRRLTKPERGQKMLKTAMSVLAKMHAAMRYNHQQQQKRYYYYDYQQQLASEAEASGHQLQHMISERKRREKLNDSFHALRTVLPPAKSFLAVPVPTGPP